MSDSGLYPNNTPFSDDVLRAQYREYLASKDVPTVAKKNSTFEGWKIKTYGGDIPSSANGLAIGGALPPPAAQTTLPDVVVGPNQLVTGGRARPAVPATNPLAVGAAGYTPTEAANLVGHYESEGLARQKGIDPYYIGVGGTDLSQAQLDQHGFPIWEGHGNSHAAGRYQFQPATWRQYAAPLGITDFSQASQDAVFRAAYLDRGFGHWAPYNTSLAAHIGQPVPAEWAARSSNPLAPSAPSDSASAEKEPWQPPPSEPMQQSPWQRLMMLSAMMQGAQVAPVQVKYDPRVGMVANPAPPVNLTMQAGLPTLPSSGIIPHQQYASHDLPHPNVAVPGVSPGHRVASSFEQPTQYVTRFGMRPYYE